MTTFCHHGATEQPHKQIDVVTLHVGDGETVSSFLGDVKLQAQRLRKLRNDSQSSNGGIGGKGEC
ncbi:hypothetical protein EMPG_14768 [Blastomyces silverae]|uniref:Uncharacterized protein n=1 Tax=Blastomyces silverae TaxID=2060906 RepID=A0A0H1BFN9_9EURO|nr:hypothetical protein EMPG_14768 [Blastomyces silverae]